MDEKKLKALEADEDGIVGEYQCELVDGGR